MNTYLYAPKDDPYHREHWEKPYPEQQWQDLLQLIGEATKHDVDFVYGFHPGKGLHFGAAEPVDWLLAKAKGLYEAGVRTFAVLFDDIPSQLEFPQDKKLFDGSLAKAEGPVAKNNIEPTIEVLERSGMVDLPFLLHGRSLSCSNLWGL